MVGDFVVLLITSYIFAYPLVLSENFLFNETSSQIKRGSNSIHLPIDFSRFFERFRSDFGNQILSIIFINHSRTIPQPFNT